MQHCLKIVAALPSNLVFTTQLDYSIFFPVISCDAYGLVPSLTGKPGRL